MKRKVLRALVDTWLASLVLVLFVAYMSATEKAGIVGQICYEGAPGESLLLEGAVVESGSCRAIGLLSVFPGEGKVLRIKKTEQGGTAYLQYGIRKEDGGAVRWGQKVSIEFGHDNIAWIFLKADSNSGTFQEVDISEALLK